MELVLEPSSGIAPVSPLQCTFLVKSMCASAVFSPQPSPGCLGSTCQCIASVAITIMGSSAGLSFLLFPWRAHVCCGPPYPAAAMDWMTVRECRPAAESAALQLPAGANKACRQGGSVGAQHNACTEAGGTCTLVRDGFYHLSALAVVAGVCMLLWLQRVLPR